MPSTIGRPTPAGLVTLRQALGHLPAVTIDDKAVEAVRQGKTWVLRTVAPGLGDTALLLDRRGEVVAVLVRAVRRPGPMGASSAGEPALHQSVPVLVTTVK